MKSYTMQFKFRALIFLLALSISGCEDRLEPAEQATSGDSFLYIPPNGLIDFCANMGVEQRAEEPECDFYRCTQDLTETEAHHDITCIYFTREKGNMRMGFRRD